MRTASVYHHSSRRPLVGVLSTSPRAARRLRYDVTAGVLNVVRPSCFSACRPSSPALQLRLSPRSAFGKPSRRKTVAAPPSTVSSAGGCVTAATLASGTPSDARSACVLAASASSRCATSRPCNAARE